MPSRDFLEGRCATLYGCKVIGSNLARGFKVIGSNLARGSFLWLLWERATLFRNFVPVTKLFQYQLAWSLECWYGYIVQPYELDHIRAWSKKPTSFLLKLPIESWKKISNFFVLPFSSSLKKAEVEKKGVFLCLLLGWFRRAFSRIEGERKSYPKFTLHCVARVCIEKSFPDNRIMMILVYIKMESNLA